MRAISVLTGALFVLTAASACGSDVPETVPPDGGSSPAGADAGAVQDGSGRTDLDGATAASCTGTFTGPVTGSFNCLTVFTNERELRFVKTGPKNEAQQLSITMTLAEPFAMRAYSLSDFSSAFVILLMDDGTQYAASKDIPESSLDVTLSAVGPPGVSAQSTHGTVTARVVETNAEAGLGTGRYEIVVRF